VEFLGETGRAGVCGVRTVFRTGPAGDGLPIPTEYTSAFINVKEATGGGNTGVQ